MIEQFFTLFRRNLHNVPVSIVSKPWFNIAGFAQPEVVINLLNGNDYDGFNDRQFFVCPADRDVDFDDLTPVPATIPNFSDLFRVVQAAREQFGDSCVYTCDNEAKVLFKEFHNNANKRKRETPRRDRDRRSIVLKSKGQVLRLSAVIFVLDQGLSRLSPESDDELSEDANESEISDEGASWKTVITADYMRYAINLMNHLIEQKFALGKQPASNTENVETMVAPSISDTIEVRKLQRMLETPGPISVTALSRAHISSKTKHANGKTYDGEYLMRRGEEEGFGKVEDEECNRGAQKSTKKVFKKHKRDELSEEKIQELRAMKVNLDKFDL